MENEKLKSKAKYAEKAAAKAAQREADANDRTKASIGLTGFSTA